MIKLYALNINSDKLNQVQFNYLLSCLQLDKQERIKKIQRCDDAVRTLTADLLVRSIICSELGIRNEDIEFDKNKYGKPYLRNRQDFHFNISHSEKWVVCATSCYPIGVDIEYIKSINLNIARRFFSEDEYRQLDACNREQRLSFFYDLWTLKESYIKATGKGLSIPLNSFSFRISQDQDKIYGDSSLEGWQFKHCEIDEEYRMAICGCIQEHISRHIIIKKLGSLYDHFMDYYYEK